MDPALAPLLQRAASPSLEEQGAALFQVAMLLEKNTRPSDEVGFYESVLPAEVLQVDLNHSAQRELLSELVLNADLRRVMPALLWAVGKAVPEVALRFLQQILERHPDWLSDPETAYQALIALDNCLDADRETRRSHRVTRALRSDQPAEFLRSASTSPNPKVAAHAARLLRRVLKLRQGHQ